MKKAEIFWLQHCHTFSVEVYFWFFVHSYKNRNVIFWRNQFFAGVVALDFVTKKNRNKLFSEKQNFSVDAVITHFRRVGPTKLTALALQWVFGQCMDSVQCHFSKIKAAVESSEVK